MEIRKHITAVLSFVLCTVTVSAQNVSREELTRQLDAASSRVDSLTTAIQDLRNLYAADPSRKDEIAAELSRLEPQAFSAKREMDRAAGELARYDMSAAHESEVSVTAKKGGKGTLMSALEAVLKTEDMNGYRATLRAQKMAQMQVKGQEARHAELEKLIKAYEACSSEEEAGSIMKKYTSLCDETASSEEMISSIWAPVYDNKYYVYCLAMEKKGDGDALQKIDAVYADAETKRQAAQGQCFSDAVSTFYIQSSAMLECESLMADRFGLPSVRDSLKREAAKTAPKASVLRKLSLPMKSFIEYENAKPVRPSRYASVSAIPEVKVYGSGVIYRIRLGVYSTKPSVTVFRNYAPLYCSRDSHPQRWACYAGGYRTEKEAAEAVEAMKKSGFRSPVVTVWADGKYYPDLESYAASDEYSMEISGTEEISDEMRKAITDINPDASISKTSDRFVVNFFRPLSSARRAEAALHAIDSRIETKIDKKQ